MALDRIHGDDAAGTTATRLRRLARVAVVPCLLAMASANPSFASAQSSDREDDLDVLTAEREVLRVELAEIEQEYEEQNARVEAARAELEQAESAAQAAQLRVERADAAVERARQSVREYAVEAYIRPPAQDMLKVLSLPDAHDAGFVSAVLTIMTEERQAAVTELLAARDAADQEREHLSDARDDARRWTTEAEQQLIALDRLRADRRSVAEQMDLRLDAALAEAAALASIDQTAADRLVEAEVALHDDLPIDTAPAAEATPPTALTPGQPPSTPTGTEGPPTSQPSTGVTWSDVTNVSGIYVHTSIASNVRSLLDAASAAGLSLGGGGYRDPAAQIATRRANCGPTDYDIYQKPASQCVPPTAIPGTSMHERGLAIDFTDAGALITSRSHRAYVWLTANASRYGLYNLPSEPWHWSTNGS